MKYINILFSLLIYFIGYSVELRKKDDTSTSKEPIELNALVISVDSGSSTFNYYVDTFNEYSIANDLNVKIKINMISNLNSTYTYDNMAIYIGDLLKKKDLNMIFFSLITLTLHYMHPIY